jgi:radical SAM-linked protein
VRLAHIVSPTGPSLTLAPEAGSARMWSIINKNVTEHDVLMAAGEAFRTGRTTLKLYFMIGLPLEEDEDVIAIAELCMKIRDLGRAALGDRSNRLQLNISVNNFIPKPFTPFQWAGMAKRGTLRRRQELLRSRLRKPGVKLTLHGVDKSYLEAALTRGGEEMAGTIEEAWRRGARFDSWTEQFSEAAWREAFDKAGTAAEQLATADLSLDDPLPWDVICGVVDREFLREEWARATRGETTPDCRWGACCACGACDGTPVLATAEPRPMTAVATSTHCGRSEVPEAGTSKSTPASEVPRWRYVACFSVKGRGRFIGHLDRSEILRRAVRRAGARLALSGGMRPKPLLSLALPLAVGVEGLTELCEFQLSEPAPPDFAARLSGVLPAHMTLRTIESYEWTRSLPSRVTGAAYEARVHAVRGDSEEGVHGEALCGELVMAARRFELTDELPIREVREGRERLVDVRRYVERVSVKPGNGGSCILNFVAAITPQGTARPERVVDALSQLAGVGLETEAITRLQVLIS